MDISTLAKVAGHTIKRNTSTILTGLAVAGSVSSAILAVRATPRALDKIEAAQQEKEEFLTKQEILKIVWKDYAPAAGVQLGTILCIVGAQRVNMRRQAALISAVTVSETAFREYQERMAVEAPTKDRKVRDDIAKELVEKNQPNNETIIFAGKGEQLFLEAHTGRYFMSDMESIRKAVNDLNLNVINSVYASQNDFYRLIGLPSVSMGDEMGWTSEHTLELDFSTQITEDGRSAIVIDYTKMPIKNYWKLYG